MEFVWKYDNRDVLVVKGAESAAEAWGGAEEFLQELGDEYTTGLPGSEGVEPLENGNYEFRVKTY